MTKKKKWPAGFTPEAIQSAVEAFGADTPPETKAAYAEMLAQNLADPEKEKVSAAPPDWDRFSVSDTGTYHTGVDREGKPTAPEWVCSRLDVEALTRVSAPIQI